MPAAMTARLRLLHTHAGALALIVLLTLVLCAPIARHLSTAVPGDEGDNLFYVRSIWWMHHALVDEGISPFVDRGAYFPEGRALARGEMTASNTLPGVPLTAAFGPVATYNILVLLSFVLSGWGTYFWVSHLTGRRSAGLVAAVIFTFLPYRFAHMGGHLPLVSTQWVPWLLWAFERFLARRTVARASVMGLLGAGLGLSSWYYGYSAALMVPLYALWRIRTVPGVWRESSWWLGLGTAAAIVLALVMPFVLPLLALRDLGEMDRTLRHLAVWMLNPYDFFLPNLAHPWWGDAAAQWLPHQARGWEERGVALGMVAMTAAVVALVCVRPRRRLWPLVGVWLASALIALGPTLYFGDQQVRVPVSESVVSAADHVASWFGARMNDVRDEMRGASDLPIPMPAFLLYMLVPFTSGMRVMSRFAMWTGLMTAALAGWGISLLRDRVTARWGPRASTTFVTLVIAAIVVESLSTIPMTKLSPRPVDHWLRAHPEVTVVADLPVEESERPMQDYWATIHHKATIISWNGDSFPPQTRWERTESMRPFPAPDSIAYLHALGTTHLLVTAARFPDWPSVQATLADNPTVTLVEAVDGVWIYALRR
jgi:hypothetical protein